MTPSGIETATFRLVAQCPKQYANSWQYHYSNAICFCKSPFTKKRLCRYIISQIQIFTLSYVVFTAIYNCLPPHHKRPIYDTCIPDVRPLTEDLSPDNKPVTSHIAMLSSCCDSNSKGLTKIRRSVNSRLRNGGGSTTPSGLQEYRSASVQERFSSYSDWSVFVKNYA